VRDVTRELLDMGCYEVSLGDTTGTGNPMSVSEMLNVTLVANPVEKLAGTYLTLRFASHFPTILSVSVP